MKSEEVKGESEGRGSKGGRFLVLGWGSARAVFGFWDRPYEGLCTKSTMKGMEFCALFFSINRKIYLGY